MTSKWLREKMREAMDAVGADGAAIGRGAGDYATVVLFFNRDKEVAHNGDHDADRPCCGRSAVVASEVSDCDTTS